MCLFSSDSLLFELNLVIDNHLLGSTPIGILLPQFLELTVDCLIGFSFGLKHLGGGRLIELRHWVNFRHHFIVT